MAHFLTSARSSIGLSAKELVPGVALVALITAAAFGLRGLSLFGMVSPMMGAILIGILFNNAIGCPNNARAGITICSRRLLRLAVALLGFQLTIWQVSSIGAGGVAAIATVLLLTFLVTVWFGKLLGVDRGLTMLIAAGTSICGASAIAAMNDVSKAHDEDVTYAVATITLFGTAAMLLYPTLIGGLNLSPEAYGFWIGASVHEVAQVVAAAFQGGEAAGQTGVVVKLTRVMMLAPLMLVIGTILTGRASGEKSGSAPTIIPLFVLGFIGCMLFNSFLTIPRTIHASIVSATPVMLTASLGAIGLGTNIGRLRQRGLRPLLLAGSATLFIALAGLVSVSFVG